MHWRHEGHQHRPKRVKVLRHHGSEIKRQRKKFNAETDVFLEECHLLLQEVIDPGSAEELIESFDDPG
ncbi:hypothetical protein LZ31DRAFT_560114 [Colletotrichum somersetense]|nr:hypothetical protein LZ31DRAFT_560114 [Colletotrichum somersetense]